MKRRDILKAIGALGSTATAGCVRRGATHSEVKAVAQVVDTEHHQDGSVTATIEVVSDDRESGTVGLHVHYFHGDYCDGNNYHTHLPTVYVPSGETVTVRDTYKHAEDVGCVSAHVHK